MNVVYMNSINELKQRLVEVSRISTAFKVFVFGIILNTTTAKNANQSKLNQKNTQNAKPSQLHKN